VTDLLMFIPVYQYARNGVLMLGTHVDALAKASDQTRELDQASLVDFILNDVVTYPHTVYKNILQCRPAAVHDYLPGHNKYQAKEPAIYWLPTETNPYANVNEAAQALRNGLQDYVSRVTEGMTQVAQFLSAGEDSRALAGMLPQRLKRDAFIFLDSMNREGKIAQKAAKAYDVNFLPQFRSASYYLDILPEAADLIGGGHQYFHAHSLRFHKSCRLNKYTAVFGGYSSDAFLKGDFARKRFFQVVLPFLPQFFVKGETRSKAIGSEAFANANIGIINQRRQDHMRRIRAWREESAHEWFRIWPSTMRDGIPNLFANRRLFRSYEPFMSKQVVKISAGVPIKWKLNRNLFRKAARPFLEPSRWIFHAEGYLPYYPWWVNSPIEFSVWCSRQIGTLAGLIKGNQGPWSDWRQLMEGEKWRGAVSEYSRGFEAIRDAATAVSAEQMFKKNTLRQNQKINLLQLLYFLSRKP
jgi:hypothetical protein